MLKPIGGVCFRKNHFLVKGKKPYLEHKPHEIKIST
nr:MAG TPA: hypothetical protein [Caudoviricetes sp.]